MNKQGAKKLDRMMIVVFLIAFGVIGTKLVFDPELSTTQYGVIDFGEYHAIVGGAILVIDAYFIWLFFTSHSSNRQNQSE